MQDAVVTVRARVRHPGARLTCRHALARARSKEGQRMWVAGCARVIACRGDAHSRAARGAHAPAGRARRCDRHCACAAADGQAGIVRLDRRRRGDGRARLLRLGAAICAAAQEDHCDPVLRARVGMPCRPFMPDRATVRRPTVLTSSPALRAMPARARGCGAGRPRIAIRYPFAGCRPGPRVCTGHRRMPRCRPAGPARQSVLWAPARMRQRCRRHCAAHSTACCEGV